MRWIVVFVAVLASACSTKYQSMGFAGGVAAEQMTTDTFRIIARGNGYTASTTVQDYMMLKAAETTKQAGRTHFIILSAADASRHDVITTPGQMNSTIVGNRVTTTYAPPQEHAVMKPGQDAYIRVLSVPGGTNAPPGAIAADEIIQFVGKRVERG